MIKATPATRLSAALAQAGTPTVSALAFFAGMLSALGFAPRESVAPTVLGIALLMFLVLSAGRPFLVGYVFGFGHFLIGLTWIATAFTFQSAMPAAIGWVAVVGLSAFLALFVAVPAWAAHRLTRGAISFPLVFAGLFTFAELLRGALFTGFPWNPLGAPWLQLDGVAALAAIIGANGLSALMVVAGASIVALLLGKDQRGRWATVLAFPLLLVIGIALPQVRQPLPAADGAELVLVQPNISQAEKNMLENADGGIERLIALTDMAVDRHPKAAAIIWPEAAVQYPLNVEPGLAKAITRPLPPGMLLLTGSIAIEEDESSHIVGARNSLYALDSTGEILMRYDKAHLVPGGEYLPLRWLVEPLGLQRLVPGDIDFLPGPGPATFTLPGLPSFGVAICYEIIFPGAVIDAKTRPEWLLTVSNDAWFGPSGPPQHHAQGRLRAIEEGMPIVRVTPTGITSLIGPRGESLVQLPQDKADIAAVRLPAPLKPTPFATVGLAAPAIFALLLVGLGIFLRDRKT